MANKIKSLLGGPGFYAVLALCVVAVGVGGYFLLLRDEASAEVAGQAEIQEELPSEQTPTAEMPAETIPETAILPEETEEPSTPAVSQEEMPEVLVDDTPVMAEEPAVVVSPLQGDVVAAFSVDQLVYNETMDDWRTHDGVDIAASQGEAVLAACAGTVESITDDPLMGTTVVLSHSGGYESVYANLQESPPVAEGETVSAGQIIGAVGVSTAEAAQGPHLHFSVLKDGEAVDPDTFLNA